MTDELALFDLPTAQPQPGPVDKRTGRGRTRETYARTVTADITVQRVPVLREAALRAYDDSPAIPVGDADDEAPDAREQIATDSGAALSWLLDPTQDLWALLEADAMDLVSVDIDIDIDLDAPTRCRARWTVTVKLRDVAAFRRVALASCPTAPAADREEIDHSLSAAWQHAADPYAPLRHIPGITFTPVEVSVEHLHARPRRQEHDR
jgi:hypothetical protein